MQAHAITPGTITAPLNEASQHTGSNLFGLLLQILVQGGSCSAGHPCGPGSASPFPEPGQILPSATETPVSLSNTTSATEPDTAAPRAGKKRQTNRVSPPPIGLATAPDPMLPPAEDPTFSSGESQRLEVPLSTADGTAPETAPAPSPPGEVSPTGIPRPDAPVALPPPEDSKADVANTRTPPRVVPDQAGDSDPVLTRSQDPGPPPSTTGPGRANPAVEVDRVPLLRQPPSSSLRSGPPASATSQRLADVEASAPTSVAHHRHLLTADRRVRNAGDLTPPPPTSGPSADSGGRTAGQPVRQLNEPTSSTAARSPVQVEASDGGRVRPVPSAENQAIEKPPSSPSAPLRSYPSAGDRSGHSPMEWTGSAPVAVHTQAVSRPARPDPVPDVSVVPTRATRYRNLNSRQRETITTQPPAPPHRRAQITGHNPSQPLPLRPPLPTPQAGVLPGHTAEQAPVRRSPGELPRVRSAAMSEAITPDLVGAGLLHTDTADRVSSSVRRPPEVSSSTHAIPAFVSQVEEALVTSTLQGQHRVRIKLDPPELGELEIDITQKGETIETRFRASDPSVGQLLHSHLGELRNALAAHGIELAEATVLVGGQSGGQNLNSERGSRRTMWMRREGVRTAAPGSPLVQSVENPVGRLNLLA